MRCFAILGPAGAGKSTLAAQLGSLEGGPAPSHSHGANGEDAQARVRLSTFRFFDEPWCAIDVRGGAEPLASARRALLAADTAVIVVPPVPDHAVLAAPYLRLVHAAATPAILFINKMDEARSRVRDMVAALQDFTADTLVLRQIPIRQGESVVGAVDLVSERAWKYREGEASALIEIPDDAREREREARGELLEQLSEFDDWLLEEVVEDREPAAGPLYAICTRTLRQGRVVPALIGSAAKRAGMTRLMKALRHEAPPVGALRDRLAEGCGAEPDSLLAAVFHGEHRRHVGKVSLVRALGDGAVGVGMQLGGGHVGALNDIETDKKVDAPLPAGAIAAAIKADALQAGTVATADSALRPPVWARSPQPMTARLIIPDNDRDDAKLSGALARLAEIDPALEVSHEVGTGALLVRVAGETHLREITHTLSDAFGVKAHDEKPHADYRETITRRASVHYRHKKQTGGAGQFADVKLIVEPLERGDGFAFTETVKGGAVPRNHIPAVEAGAKDALAKGPFGFEVVDIAVTLTDGQHHAVDSSDFAFRAAGKMGVLEALQEGAPVMLQPIHLVTFEVPSIHSGALVPLVSSNKGRVLGFEADPEAKGWDILRALMPQGALDTLAHELRSATQGTGHFTSQFDHFEEIYGAEANQAASARAAAAVSA